MAVGAVWVDARGGREERVLLSSAVSAGGAKGPACQREFFVDNLLVRIHFIIVMFRWTGLAPWEFEFPFPGSLTSTILDAFSILNHVEYQPRVDCARGCRDLSSTHQRSFKAFRETNVEHHPQDPAVGNTVGTDGGFYGHGNGNSVDI